jgi:hypothetical protein
MGELQVEAWEKLCIAACRNAALFEAWMLDETNLPWVDFLAKILREYQPKEQS